MTPQDTPADDAPRVDSTEAELDAIEALLERLAGFGADVDIEWFDGYLAARLCGPRTTTPLEALQAVFGEALERAVADPEDLQRTLDVVTARWNVVAEQLRPERLLEDEGALWYQPILMDWDEAARTKLLETGEVSEEEARALQPALQWARGFAAAVAAQAEAWDDPGLSRHEREALDACLADILLLARVPGDPDHRQAMRERHGAREPARQDLIDAACFAVQDLRLLWLERAARPAPRRAEVLPGRNDPCWCGSGKKFKKCHGA